MYGYDYYGYDPATEGFGDTIKGWIKKAGEVIGKFLDMVKGWIKKAGEKIKSLKKEPVSDERAVDLIGEAYDKSAALIRSADDLTNDFLEEYSNYGKSEDYDGEVDENSMSKRGRFVRQNNLKLISNDVGSSGEAKFSDVEYSRKMKRAKDTNVDDWNIFVARYTKEFNVANAKAKEIKDVFAELKRYKGQFGYDSIKESYEGLKEIYGETNRYKSTWKKLQDLKSFTSGKIQSAIKKIFKLYSIGESAVKALANKIVGGNTAEAEAPAATGNTESVDVVLSSIYDAAYEAAYNDIMEQQRAMDFFDSIPEYEF